MASDTAREPRSWAQAIELLLQRGDLLVANLLTASVSMDDLLNDWEQLRSAGPDVGTNE